MTALEIINCVALHAKVVMLCKSTALTPVFTAVAITATCRDTHTDTHTHTHTHTHITHA